MARSQIINVGMAMDSYYIILLELQVFHQAQEDQHCQADPAK